MSTFCYDHFEHPILWCDEKKRLMERKNAEESMRNWRRKKAEEIARRERDKQEYYEMYIKHCPWGRPGGGAPNIDIRRRDITAVGLHSTPTIGASYRLTSLQPCRFSDYFSQTKYKKCHDINDRAHHHYHRHAGHMNCTGGDSKCINICERSSMAPSLDCKNDEHLQITLKDHPAMSNRNKGHVDIEVRYKPQAMKKGKPMLEKIVAIENDQCPPTTTTTATDVPKSPKKKPKASFAEKTQTKEVWGKAGPGGKPWRSSKDVGSTFMKSLGWTNKEMLKELDQDNPATPAEKPALRKSRSVKKPERCCTLCTCKCPAMLKPLQRKSILCKDELKSTNCDLKPKICPKLAHHCTDTHYQGVELVPLLAHRRAAHRPISLCSTDVTKRTCSDNRSALADPRYLNDLNAQISQKRRSVSLTKQLERDLSSKHFENFDKFWGRPGHGAPSDIKTKLKLDDLLYGVQQNWSE